jgi:hypothetical protein
LPAGLRSAAWYFWKGHGGDKRSVEVLGTQEETAEVIPLFSPANHMLELKPVGFEILFFLPH